MGFEKLQVNGKFPDNDDAADVRTKNWEPLCRRKGKWFKQIFKD